MRRFRPVHTMALAVLSTLLICAPVMAQDDNSQSSGSTLEGVWQVDVSILSACGGGPSGKHIPVFLTFTRDGKVIEASGTPLTENPAVQRLNPGLGNWTHQRGEQFSAVYWFFRINPGSMPPNLPAGSDEITEVIELSQDADSFTSNGTADVYDHSGNFLLRGCHTLTGTRLE